MPQHSSEYYAKQLNFNDRFPKAFVAILATIQLLITLSIVALEIGHILYGITVTNLLAGFWTSIPFTVLWISMFATVCCCRQRSCATHALIQNIISIVFAFILIGINASFLRRPDHCFFSSTICNDLDNLDLTSSDLVCVLNWRRPNCRNTRISLIKGQLAAGVLMVVTCFIYLIVYFAVRHKASKATRRQKRTAPHAVMAPVYHQPVSSNMNYNNHQPYIVSPNPYEPSAPYMVQNYPQVHTQMPSSINNVNYLPPNQEPTLYPNISNARF